MVDQGNQAAAYGSLRSVLRALDEEDDTLPMPAYDGPDWHHPEITPGTAVVCRYERVPTSNAEGGVAGSPAPSSDDDERPKGRFALPLCDLLTAASKTGAAITFAAPAAGLLLAGALFMLPAPNGQWARAALEELRLEEAIGQSVYPVSAAPHEGIGPAAAVAADSPQPAGGIRAFAEQAQRALAANSGTDMLQELPPARD